MTRPANRGPRYHHLSTVSLAPEPDPDVFTTGSEGLGLAVGQLAFDFPMGMAKKDQVLLVELSALACPPGVGREGRRIRWLARNAWEGAQSDYRLRRLEGRVRCEARERDAAQAEEAAQTPARRVSNG